MINYQKKKILNSENNLLLGCVYILPENTKYTSNESFTENENEMFSLSNKYDCYTSLIGDMNVKTKLLEDVTVPDDSLFEILDEFDNQSLIPYICMIIKMYFVDKKV